MSRRVDRRGFWREALKAFVPPPEALAPAPDPTPARSALLRPPGALAEADFLSTCAPGCRHCVDACPRFAIIPSLDPSQPGGGDGRPYLLPDRAACDLCSLCMPACPTGALLETPPAEVRIGLAWLHEAACVRSRGEACRLCLEACPFPGEAIRDSGAFPVVVASACTGCGLCAEHCPAQAITVEPIEATRV